MRKLLAGALLGAASLAVPIGAASATDTNPLGGYHNFITDSIGTPYGTHWLEADIEAQDIANPKLTNVTTSGWLGTQAQDFLQVGWIGNGTSNVVTPFFAYFPNWKVNTLDINRYPQYAFKVVPESFVRVGLSEFHGTWGAWLDTSTGWKELFSVYRGEALNQTSNTSATEVGSPSLLPNYLPLRASLALTSDRVPTGKWTHRHMASFLGLSKLNPVHQ